MDELTVFWIILLIGLVVGLCVLIDAALVPKSQKINIREFVWEGKRSEKSK